MLISSCGRRRNGSLAVLASIASNRQAIHGGKKIKWPRKVDIEDLAALISWGEGRLTGEQAPAS
jgi:hypothetical protein